MEYDGVVLKPELNEETLEHFGIKGMKWRHRKGRKKADLLSNRPRARQKNVTGSGGKVRKTVTVDAASKFREFVNRYDQAKTDEEKKAMATAAGNAGYKAVGKGSTHEVTNIGGKIEERKKKKK